MGQFTIYENENEHSRNTYPYFIAVQNELLDSLNSRMVIPLAQSQTIGQAVISKLCPKIMIAEKEYIFLTHQMTNVPISALNAPISDINIDRDELFSALDFLITGI